MTTSRPSESTLAPGATCTAGAGFDHQQVRCEAEGLVEGGSTLLRVRPLDDAGAPGQAWVSGEAVGADGRVEVAVEVPCDQAGAVEVVLTGPLPEDGSYDHAEVLTLAGGCRTSPWLSPDGWAGVAGALVIVTLLAVLVELWRHRRRRHRLIGRRRGRRPTRRRRRPARRSRPRRQGRRRAR